MAALALEVRGHAERVLGNDEAALQSFTDSLGLYDDLLLNVGGGPQQSEQYTHLITDQTHEGIDILVSLQRYEEAFKMAEREKGQVLLGVLSGDAASLNHHLSQDEQTRERQFETQMNRLNGEIAKTETAAKPCAENLAVACRTPEDTPGLRGV